MYRPASVSSSGHRLHLNSANMLLFSSSVTSDSFLQPHRLSGSSVHGIFQARTLEWVFCHFLLQVIFSTHGWNPRLLHGQAGILPLSHLGSHLSTWGEGKAAMLRVRGQGPAQKNLRDIAVHGGDISLVWTRWWVSHLICESLRAPGPEHGSG